jgi:hypothetical protein
MSRRSHHGRTTHAGRGQRGDSGRPVHGPGRAAPGLEPRLNGTELPEPLAPLPVAPPSPSPRDEHGPAPGQADDPTFRRAVDSPPAGGQAPTNGGPQPRFDANTGCTAPQLRRFIKSRAYVPMHELRRRFGINGGEDDVTGVELHGTWIYVGLPGREGGLLGELMRGGEVGYELSLDPRTPVVIGVYPMRPVPRH